jgi:hypothetical protein
MQLVQFQSLGQLRTTSTSLTAFKTEIHDKLLDLGAINKEKFAFFEI